MLVTVLLVAVRALLRVAVLRIAMLRVGLLRILGVRVIWRRREVGNRNVMRRTRPTLCGHHWRGCSLKCSCPTTAQVLRIRVVGFVHGASR